MVGPATGFIVAFMIIPIGLAAYLSLTDWNGIERTFNLVGLENYARLLRDKDVAHATAVTLVIAGVGTVVCNILGLGLAVLLQGPGKVNTGLRMVFFYPFVIGAVIIGFLWSAILGTNGAINVILATSDASLPFLAQPAWALGSITFVVIWSIFGVNLVLYLAGLQTVPVDLLEAARIDGATPWQSFRGVSLPLLAPIVTVNIVLTLVALLRVYEVILALTTGGPAGQTQSVAFLILSSSFRRNQLGYGSAQAIVLMIAIGALAIVITRMRRRAESAVSA